jgi:sugar lactone lactonase YvrE
MAHRAMTVLFCALLTACGGGEGSSTNLTADSETGNTAPGSNTASPPAVTPATPVVGGDPASPAPAPVPPTTDPSMPGTFTIAAKSERIVAGGDGLRLEVTGHSDRESAQWGLRPGSPGKLDRNVGASVLYTPPPAGSTTHDTVVVVTATVGQTSTSVELTLLPSTVAVADPPPPPPAQSPAVPTPIAQGISLFVGNDGGAGWRNGIGTAARFQGPHGMTRDTQGNIYVVEVWNSTIRKIAPDGSVTTLAGSITPWPMKGVDGTGAAARFVRPHGITVDAAGNLYVTDDYDHTIRKITPAGVVTTLAGKAGEAGNTNGVGEAARFNRPQGIAADASGNLYVVDYNNMMIRKITPTGVVTTFAQNDMNAPAEARVLSGPTGIGIDAAGNLYVTDAWISRTGNPYKVAALRKITPQGAVSTMALRRTTGTEVQLYYPGHLTLDSLGNIFITEQHTGEIWKITSDGVATIVNHTGSGWNYGFTWARGIVMDSDGNLLVADEARQVIRKVMADGTITTVFGTEENKGTRDGSAGSALFNLPTGVTNDTLGNLYVADRENHTIRKISPLGEVTTLAGNPGQFGTADGTANSARFDYPHDVATDASGNVYVADTYYGDPSKGLIRKITPAGVVTTLATDIHTPAISVDAAGNVYAVDQSRTYVWKITPGGVRSIISHRTAAEINRTIRIQDMTVDATGNIFVTTFGGIRKIAPSGVTFIGPQDNFTESEVGPHEPGPFHSSLTIDQEGNLYTIHGRPSLPYRAIRKTTQTGETSDVFNLKDLGVGTSGFAMVGSKTIALPVKHGIYLLKLP